MPDTGWVPANYAQARRRLVATAALVRARVRSYVCAGATPCGQPLAVEAISIGDPNARTGIVIISGTHGVEGYAGSGVQHRLLADGTAQRIADQGAHLVLVHALNPYGFAWDRRVTHEGIDLMRNVVDHTDPPDDDPLVAELAPLLVPEDLHGPAWRAAQARLRRWQQENGYGQFRTAVARGQYRHPELPFYGGTAPAWSQTTFRRIVHERLGRHSTVIALDIHTGLGANGCGQLIGTHPLDSPQAERGATTWGTDYVPNGAAGSVSYDFTGSLLHALDQEVAPGTTVVSAAHEFGTVPEADVLTALRADHTLHAIGTDDPAELARVRAGMREAFCDADPAWFDSVYRQVSDAAHVALAEMRTHDE